MVRVTVYSRPGCHLCEIARQRVGNVLKEVEFEVEEVDISTDPGLSATYGERIPVVSVEGEEVCVYRVSEKLLKRRVKEASERKGRCSVEEQVQAQEQPHTGIPGRIIGTFVSPGDTFASVRASSSWADWVVPWVIWAVIASGAALKAGPIAIEAIVQHQREQIQENVSLSEEQKKDSIARIEKMTAGGSAVARTFIMTPLTILAMLAVLSAVCLGVANFLFGGKATYQKVMSVTAYAGIILAVGGAIQTWLMVARNSIDVSIGPAVLLSPEMEHTWAHRIASGIDIFWIWYLVVVSIGVGAVSGASSKGIGAVIFPLWLIVIVGGGAVVKNMMGF